MSTKVIAVISQDTLLQEIAGRMDVRHEYLKGRIKFLQKQAENEAKKIKAQDDVDWKIMGEHLVKIGKLESYDDNKTCLAVNSREDCVRLHDHDGDDPHTNSLARLLEGLFR